MCLLVLSSLQQILCWLNFFVEKLYIFLVRKKIVCFSFFADIYENFNRTDTVFYVANLADLHNPRISIELHNFCSDNFDQDECVTRYVKQKTRLLALIISLQ